MLEALLEVHQPVSLVLVGFLLAVLWDQIKHRRSMQSRDREIIDSLYEELTGNLKLIEANTKLIEDDDGKIRINVFSRLPLWYFREGFSDYFLEILSKLVFENLVSASIS